MAEKSPLIAGPLAIEDSATKGTDDTMAQNIFQFSGPVTIQVGPGSTLPTTALSGPVIAPPQVALVVTPKPGDQPEFREKT